MKTIPFLKHEVISLTIDSLASGGAGVGRYQGFVIFTPFTCPEDQVRVRITRIKKNFAEAELVSVEVRGEKRVLPQCSVFQICGGCTWQHISYEEQLRQKQKIVESSLRKKPLLNSAIVKNIIASPKQWEYRNRIQLKINTQGDYGFFAKNSHDLVKIKNCPIADPILFQDLDPVIKQLSTSTFPKKVKSKAFVKKHQHQNLEVYLSSSGEVKYISRGLLQYSKKNAFAQVNQWINQILIDDILKYLKQYLLPNQVVYDLYCGHGNFTFPINKVLHPVKTIGVELNLDAVNRAKKEVSNNKVLGLEFFAQDVQYFLNQCNKLEGPVLIDPPRVGCDKKVLLALKKLKPTVIFYVSCNPQTLTRDLEILIGEEQLYEIIFIQPYDMFPQTDHVESLAVLKLKRVGV